MWLQIIAGICLAWYVFIAIVCSIGRHHYFSAPAKPASSFLPAEEVPHVTVIRPVKGLEPYLYECLAATFHQDYPESRLTVHFCISSRNDPAHGILQRLLREYSSRDAQIFVEEEDPLLLGDEGDKPSLGPNPKIRNMSRGYREAKSDIVWIIDCNVWVSKGACGRMVDKLCGLGAQHRGKTYKFVHHLPICVDVNNQHSGEEAQALLSAQDGFLSHTFPQGIASGTVSKLPHAAGGRLEEVFLASSHAKFYTAINTVAVAPCIVGKSNMFRRAHLNYLTSPRHTANLSSPDPASSELPSAPGVGIDHFSYNICEDHLIGDLLWRSAIPNEPSIRNHGIVWGDLAIQPISSMSLSAYVARRVRWLRVRKFTVTLATLVEPGTESFLCSLYGAFGVTFLPWFQYLHNTFPAWLVFMAFWLFSISVWAYVDWTEYLLLHSGRTIETDGDAPIPAFAKPLTRTSRRPFRHWLFAWLGRETLALPIWAWAFWGGVTVVWRDRKFWVGMDMKVHEIDEKRGGGKHDGKTANGGLVDIGKARTD